MGLPIEKWARQATVLQPPPKRVAEDINDLIAFERQNWPRLMRELKTGGDPQFLESTFGGMMSVPPVVDGAATAAGTSEVELWGSGNTARYAPIPANAGMGGEVFRLAAHGLYTTAAVASNWTLTPRIGTSTSGGTLGASVATALPSSAISNMFWYIIGDVTFRTIGSGTNATAIAMFHCLAQNTAPPSNVNINMLFGNTQAAFDSTAAQGMWMGTTTSASGATFVTRQLHWMSWN